VDEDAMIAGRLEYHQYHAFLAALVGLEFNM
jgi:hypothetical protein